MSAAANVDSRVVEMHFDNSDFMDKVKETIASLEMLNDRIDALNASKGLSGLADGANGKDLNGVADAVGNIESRFSNMGIVGMTIMQRLTNAGIDMATKVTGVFNKAFGQIKQGGFVRAENIEQAKFLLEGLGADVEGVFDRVDKAVTGTSYGIDEAAKVASSFYASGITDLDKLQDSLRAVAGVAAMTGSDYASIGDIFTTVAGQGKVMTMQLRMMEGRGLNGAATMAKFFSGVNKGSIDASDSVKKAVKELTSSTDVSEEQIRDFVSKGKIDFEVFSAAMDNAFGEHAQAANKTFSGSLANMKTALSRLGEAFITPGMQAAIPLFNSLRMAISAFTTVLKDSELITSLWTTDLNKLSSSISVIFTKMRDSGMIREAAILLINAYIILSNVLRNVADAFRQVFDIKSSEKFLGAAEAMEKFNHKLEEVIDKTRKMETFKNVMVSIFSIFRIAGNIASGILKIIHSLVSGILGLTSSTSGLGETIANTLQKIAEKSSDINIFDTLSEVVSKASDIIRRGLKFIIDGVLDLVHALGDAGKNIQNFSDAMILVGTAFSGQFIWRKFIFGLQELWKNLKIIFHPREGITGALAEFTKMPKKVSGVLGTLIDNLKVMQYEVDSKIIKNLALSLLMLSVALTMISRIDVADLSKALGAITILMIELGGMLKVVTALSSGDMADTVKGLVAIGGLTNALIKIGVAMILIAEAVKILSVLNVEELVKGLSAFTIILGSLLGFMVGISKFTEAMGPKLKGVATTIIGVSVALLILSKAVDNLGAMDLASLGKGLGSIIVLLGALFGFIIGISNLAKAGGAGMIAVGAGLVLMASAINIIAPAIDKIGSLDLTVIGKGLLGIAGALTALALASQFMSIGGAAGILLASIAVVALANAIKTIGSLDIEKIKNGLLGIAGALAMFMAVGTIIAIFPQIAMGLAAISLALLSFGAAVALAGAGLVMIGAGLVSISAGLMSFASVSQTALLMFSNVITIAIKTVINLLPTIVASLAESFVVFLETIAELAPRFTEAMTTIITCLIQAVNDNVPRLVNTGINLIIKLLEGVNEAIPKLAALGVSIIAGFVQGVADNISAVIEAGINLILALINGLADGVREHAGDIRDAILNLCKAMFEAFCSFWGIHSPSTVAKRLGINIVQGLINGIKSLGKSIGTALIKAVKTGYNGIKNFVRNFKNAGVSILTHLVSGIKSKASSIKTALTSLISSAKNAITNKVSEFTTAGKNLVSGIASGIRNGLSSVISAVGSIAKRALDHFKSKLGISSPSKVFASESRWIPEGIAVGIKKSSKVVDNAVSRMGDRAVTRMGKVIKDINDSLSIGDDFNPTITPVLDLTSVRKDAGKIGGILNGRSISATSETALMSGYLGNSALSSMIDSLSDTLSGKSSNQDNSTNYYTFNVDGAENPEDFANRFIRSLKKEMRAV